MLRITCLVVLACLLQGSVQRSTPEDDSYVAAVLEYAFQGTTTANLNNYLRFIQEAAEQTADIIVFPELTLTRIISVEIPMGTIVQQYPTPALNPEYYNEVLVAISAAAREHQIYVVINLEEILDCTTATGEYCPEVRSYLFNSNIVFDRNGTIIDRYRKINLFGEFSRTPALQPDLGYFDTDFGVTFGHYICFDLQFQVPAFQVVEMMNVTDVVFTTMWFSELPYLTAVQIQEAYAYSKNINFLGSGGNNVRAGSAGSGIYSGKAGALASTMPGVPTTRLLVSRVPKVPGQVTGTVPGPTYDPPTDHDSLLLIVDPSLPSHVTRLLAPGYQEFNLTDKEVTCSFRINLSENQPSNGAETYKYRAGAFSGVRSYSGMATGGTRICSVFACTGDTIDTCGRRFTQYNAGATAIFNELSIVATVPTPIIEPSVQASDSGYFPVSVDTSIMPLEPEYYTYSEDANGNVTVYTMVLNTRTEELYSFAIWGRYFPTDGQEADPPGDSHFNDTESPVDVTASPDVTGSPGTPVTESPTGQPDGATIHQLSAVLIIALALVSVLF